MILLQPLPFTYQRKQPQPSPKVRPVVFEPTEERRVVKRDVTPRFVTPKGKALSTGLVTYTWQEGNTYSITASADAPCTITLPPGEKLASKVSADGERWDIGYAKASETVPAIEMIQLRPTGPGYEASTQLLTKSGHIYILKLRSQETPGMLSVKFELPEEGEEMLPGMKREGPAPVLETTLPFPQLNLQRVHTGYTIEVTKGAPAFVLLRVLDDSRMSILEFSEDLSYTAAPAVFVTRANGAPGIAEWSVWNTKGVAGGKSYYVLNGIYPQLTLRGEAGEITITRDATRRSPGNLAASQR
jgi:type IV secretory pathway VirB9-like protein